MTTETFNYDHPISGSDEISTTSVTILSGQNLDKYAVIGQVSASGKFKESVSSANDGSEVPVYITAFPIDASGGDTKVQVIKSGTFDPAQLAWHTSFTAAQKLNAFVGTPISLQSQATEL